jgi:3'(2'), 5'-bisphosphate nucleotidase
MGSPTDRPVLSATIDLKAAARLMAPLTELVALAGAAILKVDRTRMRIDGKADGSPVTEADLAADRIIADGLNRLAPDIPTLSEERVKPVGGCPKELRAFFLIDPLDGTKEFVAGRNEFTVNLALVVDGTPLLGIIGAPALGLIWRGLVGQSTDKGTDKYAERLAITNSGIGLAQPIRTRPFPSPGKPWIAAVSRSHGDAATEAFIDARPGAIRERLGSALKLAKVAEGAVDIYPRLAPTSEWDIAAGHAIVTAAGGKVTDAAGGDLRFGQGFQQGFQDGSQKGAKDFIVPAFIAWGDPTGARAGRA